MGEIMGEIRGHGSRWCAARAPAVFLAAGAVTGLLAGGLPAGAAAAPGPPVPVLHWHDCAAAAARGFQCATARVPLDYTAPTGRAISIAVIRHRATGPGLRLGSLFVNYGGPGGTGVSSLPGTYRLFPAPLRERFDIVSFDPRGTGESTAVRCFPSAAAETRFFASLPRGFPVGPAQTRRWVRGYAALGRRCEHSNPALLPHLGTADVARDMDLLRQAVGDPGLNYLGLSYGTYLGATYANLFPQTVRALVLDGAVTPSAWARPRQAGRVPLGTFLRIGMDMGRKATLGQFLDLCGQASTRHCAFSAGSASATRARYAALLRRLRRHSVTVAIPGLGRRTVTYAGLVDAVANDLYTTRPTGLGFPGWASLARILRACWLASARRVPARPARAPVLPRPAGPLAAGAAAADRYPGTEQQSAILCSDSPNPRSTASYPAQAAFGFARSDAFGPDVAWLSEPCATWPATAASDYHGPWHHWTASPIVVIGVRYDPATHYQGALGEARELARGRLLTLDGYGHTAFLNPSTCIDRYEVAYFIRGTLPPRGAVCHQDRQPFQ